MHTILGAGGPVANALTRQLINKNENIRLASRRPSTFKGDNISWQKTDLLNYNEVLNAVKGSEVFYLIAGLVYDKDVWRQQWPVIMQNMINAAKDTGSRFIFFDNVYMYGLVNGAMTENTPYKPVSVKGEIRAKVATQLMDEVAKGNITATILRGADFYGAETMNSFLDSMVLSKYAKGEKAQWMGNPKCLHNFSYLPDCGTAMRLLGETPEADNQIWHVPTAKPITGTQFLELAASIYGVAPKYMRINKLMLQTIGLFNKLIRGTVEMYYQTDHDYIFDSTKFENYFKVKPTSYRDGFMELSKTLHQPKA